MPLQAVGWGERGIYTHNQACKLRNNTHKQTNEQTDRLTDRHANMYTRTRTPTHRAVTLTVPPMHINDILHFGGNKSYNNTLSRSRPSSSGRRSSRSNSYAASGGGEGGNVMRMQRKMPHGVQCPKIPTWLHQWASKYSEVISASNTSSTG